MRLLAALALAWVTSPALAIEVAGVGDKAAILPLGRLALVAPAVLLREPILTILLPIITASITRVIRKVYPWAALFLSQRRVEMRLERAVSFRRKSVNGAAKGKTLSVNVAMPVIAEGTQYVIDTAPPAVIKAAGGADGIAARIFRRLDLDDRAGDATELVPAQEQVGAGTVDAHELRRTDKMTPAISRRRACPARTDDCADRSSVSLIASARRGSWARSPPAMPASDAAASCRRGRVSRRCGGVGRRSKCARRATRISWMNSRSRTAGRFVFQPRQRRRSFGVCCSRATNRPAIKCCGKYFADGRVISILATIRDQSCDANFILLTFVDLRLLY
ncbi:hypothetical protein [Methylorubrum extorquens]|uniref:hypothetical protein n=1 Tax=Methylorubrum extorquens TaxID=408 RepID=UPI000A952DA7